MASKSIFGTIVGRCTPRTDAVNEAGGVAFAMSPKQALAQYAATGCFNATFYATAEAQLARVLDLALKVEPEFVAKVALHTRSSAHMKDMPAALVALLSRTSPGLMAEVFDRVIDSPKMLRNFVQIMRSGAVGRRSFGTLPKRMVAQWLAARTDEALFRASVGSCPSLADVIRLAHPRPATASRAALHAYLLGRSHDAADLPEIVRRYEAFKAAPDEFGAEDVPEVPMEMLTSLRLESRHWVTIARRASWQSLRMNLSTFTRHGVFQDRANIVDAASRLRDPALIARSRVLPYQLLAAYRNADGSLAPELLEALQDAMDIATSNVPALAGRVWVFADVSGSMHAPVTGHRKGSTTKVRCVDVAALMAAAILRRNPGSGVLAFSSGVIPVRLNPRDSLMTSAATLASLPAGGTDCAAPLRHLNERGLGGDLVVYVSDSESWMDSQGRHRQHNSSATMEQWRVFKRRSPTARMVCIDIQPYGTSQAPDRADILNVGGFSDAVFEVVGAFAHGTMNADHWVGVIDKEII